MIKKCCGNDVATFAKLSHVTLYARTATDEICQWWRKVSLP